MIPINYHQIKRITMRKTKKSKMIRMRKKKKRYGMMKRIQSKDQNECNKIQVQKIMKVRLMRKKIEIKQIMMPQKTRSQIPYLQLNLKLLNLIRLLHPKVPDQERILVIMNHRGQLGRRWNKRKSNDKGYLRNSLMKRQNQGQMMKKTMII